MLEVPTPVYTYPNEKKCRGVSTLLGTLIGRVLTAFSKRFSHQSSTPSLWEPCLLDQALLLR